ncbi:MAG: molybdopterin-dependent oxidoreductase [Pseudomonadota bacterium]
MERRTVRTMCPMNCHPTLCGMQVTLDHDTVVDISGDPENPDSQGFLCLRGRTAKEILDNPRRLLYPQIRVDRSSNEWRQISWNDALAHIATRLRNVAPEAFGIWLGHGDLATNYGTRLGGLLSRRFAHLYGANWWHPAMVCWGLGGFGLGLTGVLDVNTKEDLGAHADLVILWGASVASQPNTLPHLRRARARGAKTIAIDVRENETTARADDVLLLKPRSDAALALSLMHVLIERGLIDATFIAEHTIGFDALKTHVAQFTPEWGSRQTGLPAERIVWLAEQYGSTPRAMIVLGGSSMHKHEHGWMGPRAIACLPALTGKLGRPGTGFGPRHGANPSGVSLNTLVPDTKDQCADRIPDQMPAMLEAFGRGDINVLLMSGTNMMSSFADTNTLAEGLEQIDLIVCHDLFENDTIRAFADVVLPGTAWLEQLGCKMTNTHLYLMDQFLPPPGETHSLSGLLRDLAGRLSVDDFFPWENDAGLIDAVLAHPSLDGASVERLREAEGILPLPISHHAYPNRAFPTPSGKIEFVSNQARQLGCSALPDFAPDTHSDYPLRLTYGRTLTHFHGFYDHGDALPTLRKRRERPTLWISERDADDRGIRHGDRIAIHNARGEFGAVARVTEQIGPGVVWIRDGWFGLNALSSSQRAIPDCATTLFPFGTGQAAYHADVDVRSAEE